MSEPTRVQPSVAPAVTTRSPWHVSRIPAHLGRARTSTVVLGVLFVAIFALYLYVKPAAPNTAAARTSTQPPVTTTAPAPRPTTSSRTTEPSRAVPTTTASPAPTTSQAPTRTTTSQSPTISTVPTTTPSLPTPTPTPTPTLSSPSG